MANSTLREEPEKKKGWRRILVGTYPYFINFMWSMVLFVVLYGSYHIFNMASFVVTVISEYYEWLQEVHETECMLVKFIFLTFVVWTGTMLLYGKVFGGARPVDVPVYVPPVAPAPIAAPVVQRVQSDTTQTSDEVRERKKAMVIKDKEIIRGMRHYHGSEPWDDFQAHFDLVATTCDWDEPEKRIRMVLSLRTTAEAFLCGIEEQKKATYSQVVKLLRDRFGPYKEREIYVSEARNRRIKKGENFREFGQAIEELLRKAYPGDPKTVEFSAVQFFCDNCGGGTIQEHIAMEKPKTVIEAVAAAQYWKDVMKPLQEKSAADESRRRGGYVHSITTPELGKEGASAEGANRGRGAPRGRGMSSRGVGRPQGASGDYQASRMFYCYRCGVEGHIATSCQNAPNPETVAWMDRVVGRPPPRLAPQNQFPGGANQEQMGYNGNMDANRGRGAPGGRGGAGAGPGRGGLAPQNSGNPNNQGLNVGGSGPRA
jgi:hypothetical protein